MKVKTSCKECVFRINDENGVQNGCQVGRLEKFKKKNKAILEDSSYTISQTCNMGWKDPISQERAREEAITPFYLFVNATEQDELPLNLIEELKEKNYPKLFVHFIFDRGKFVDIFSTINKTVDYQFKFKVSKVTEEEGVNFMVSDAVKSLKPNYFVGFSDIGSKPHPNCLEDIDNILNEELQSLVCYIDEGVVFFNQRILTLLYKEATSVMDVEFYIMRVMEWARGQGREDLLWIRK